MGVTKPLGNYSALPSVPEELQSIIKTDKDDTTGTFPGVIMLNEKFTESAMRSSLQNKFSLVHVASHFRFSPGDETKSFLLLGDGKELTLDRIKNAPGMFRGVDLLTLSACNTAAYGSDADGKEVEGFGELAQRQSARSVIVSLWPIVDSSTAILMAKFYKLTKETTGVSKGQALRQAQLSLLRGNYIATSSFASNTRGDDQHHASGGSSFSYDPAKPFAHPHYWAPFVMIGNWR